MHTCKNLIGTLFIYNDKPSKIEKKETKKKIKYFRYDCDYFGNITNERGVEHLEDDRLDRGIISFETIDTFDGVCTTPSIFSVFACISTFNFFALVIAFKIPKMLSINMLP